MDERGCNDVLQLITNCRGAMNGLLAVVLEDHIRTHLVDGLVVNLASVWLLSGDHHGHSHGHGHGHGDDHGYEDERGHEDEVHRISDRAGKFALSVFEDGVPPVFRITPETAYSKVNADAVSITTVRRDGTRQIFRYADRDGYLESVEEIPEPHAFSAVVRLPNGEHQVEFEEHNHDHANAKAAATRDHNIRSATFTSLPTRRFLFWRLLAFCWHVRLAGSGWIRLQG